MAWPSTQVQEGPSPASRETALAQLADLHQIVHYFWQYGCEITKKGQSDKRGQIWVWGLSLRRMRTTSQRRQKQLRMMRFELMTLGYPTRSVVIFAYETYALTSCATSALGDD